MVSEVIFPRFWGVVCYEKCFRNFEIVIGSAVSEMPRFVRFYVVFTHSGRPFIKSQFLTIALSFDK